MELKNAINELTSSLEGINSRFDQAEENQQTWRQVIGNYPVIRAKGKKCAEILKDLWGITKWTNINIKKITEGKWERKGAEHLLKEIMNKTPKNSKHNETKVAHTEKHYNKFVQTERQGNRHMTICRFCNRHIECQKKLG